MIMLTTCKIINHMKDVYPPMPEENGTGDKYNIYKWWYESDEITQCYIVASLDVSI